MPVFGTARSEASTVDRREARVAPIAALRRPRERPRGASGDSTDHVCRWRRARCGSPLENVSLRPRCQPQGPRPPEVGADFA
jgi:hypothetical protein